VAKFFIYHLFLWVAFGCFTQAKAGQTIKSFGDPALDTLYGQAYELLDHAPDTCVMLCNKGLARINTMQKNPEAWTAFLSLRAFGYEHLGFYRKALNDQFIVLEYHQKTKSRNLGLTYNNVGVIYDFMGNLDSALYYYQKGYQFRKKLNDLEGISASAGNLGLLYLNKGDFKLALDYLFEAKKIAEKIKDTSSMSSCYTNIGLAYDDQGNHRKALEYYSKSVYLDSLLGDELNMAIGFNNLGSVHFTLKDFEKALNYHKKSLYIRLKANNRAGLAESYSNLALVYMQRREFEKAEAHFRPAIEIATEINDEHTLLQTFSEYGNYWLMLKKPGEAIKYLEMAMALNKKGVYGDIHKAYNYLAKAYDQKGDYEKAYNYFKLYSAIDDSLKSYENSKKLTELEMSSEFEHQKEVEALKRKADEKHDFIIRVSLICGLVAMVIIIVIVLRSYRNKKAAHERLMERNAVITSQNTEIEMQKQEIEEKNKDITDSIHYALRLQNAMLPHELFLSKHLNEYFILFKPKDIVSGDFYWAHNCGGNKFLFAVVDCTGHGVPGSMVSIIANNALNRAVSEFKLVHPADILNKLAELVEEYFNKNSADEIRDGMDISLCLFDRNTKQLEFAGANNSLWIVRYKAQHTTAVAIGNKEEGSVFELIEVKADKQPIGRYEYRSPFTNHTIQLQASDWIYLHTDGYGDQFGGPEVDRGGKKFKSGRLKQLLTQAGNANSADKKLKLEETLAQWAAGYEQNDDICIMGIKV